MSGNQDAPVFLRPAFQADFAFVFDMIIFGGAGGVKYAQIFQRLPDIPDKETGNGPERRVEQTGLMPVRQVEGHTRPAPLKQVCGENDSLVKSEGRKQGLHLLGLRTEKSIAAFGGVAPFPFHNVVIAIEKIQPVFLVELFEEPEDIAVHVNDIFHVSVFPKLIPVTQLDIGKSLTVVMLQRGKI